MLLLTNLEMFQNHEILAAQRKQLKRDFFLGPFCENFMKNKTGNKTFRYLFQKVFGLQHPLLVKDLKIMKQTPQKYTVEADI